MKIRTNAPNFGSKSGRTGVWRENIDIVLMMFRSKFAKLAFLTPPFLGGISAEVCAISPHNSDFL
jgi:predicted Abi (CAAX) family protease